MDLKKKKICIIGLGYVGLPLSIEFAKKFHVVGYDISNQRIKELKENIDTTFEVSSRLIKSVKQNINFVNDIEDAKKCDIYIITVPTPINKNNSPNLSPLLESTRAVGGILKKKILLYMNLPSILESQEIYASQF